MSRATRNLSEKLLDMVEQDPRFIGLTASATLAWVKIIRLLDRNGTERGLPPEIATSWDEMRLHLHVSTDRLITLMDTFHALDLGGWYRNGEFRVPREAIRIMAQRPAEKRAAKLHAERFRQEEEARRLRASNVDGEA